MTRRVRLLTATLACLTVPSHAFGYCRTTTCDREGAPPECLGVQVCTYTPVAKPIFWPDTCVSTSVSAFGSRQGISADDLRSIVNEAFQKWTTAPCRGGGVPSFVVDVFPDVRCTEVTGYIGDEENGPVQNLGYKEKGPNYNVWIFRDDDWPYDSIGEKAIAITTTQFNATSGEIYDSDVELNSRDNVFTLGDENVQIDLRSVVLHEAGHFLGLAHASLPSAVMTPTLDAGDASRRNLDPDDIDGICSIYLPQRPLNPTCDPEPRHGFSTECSARQMSCGVARVHRRAPTRGLTATWVGIALLSAGMYRRRIRSGSRASR